MSSPRHISGKEEVTNSTPYHPLNDQTVIDIPRSHETASSLDEDYNKVINDICEDFWAKCCSSMCMGCSNCCTALGECTQALCAITGSAVVNTVEATNTALISPTFRSLDRIVSGPQRNDNWEIPKNLLMIPGNPLMVAAEIFAKQNGGLTLIPFQPALARALECVDLLTSARKLNLDRTERAQRTLAGLTALVFAGYCALYAAVLTDMIQEDHRDLNKLIPNPMHMVQGLHASSWHAMQWSVASIGGYVAATNGYMFGKELMLSKVVEGWKNLWTNVRVDAIQRHLETLANTPNPEARAEQDRIFQEKYKEGKGLWHLTDVLGRTLEQTISMATYPLRAARDLASHLTSYKPVIRNLTNAKERAATVVSNIRQARTEEQSSGVCAKMIGCFYQKPAVSTEKTIAENYDEVLKQKKQTYYRAAPSTLKAGLFGYKQPESAQEIRLQGELVDHYKRAMRAYATDQALESPLAVNGEAANGDWYVNALRDPKIISLLNGQYRNEKPLGSTPMHELAKEYNQALYGHYSGHKPSAPSASSISRLG